MNKRVVGGLAWVALLLAAVLPARANNLIASGDGQNLWILQPKASGDRFNVLHRRLSDQPLSRLHLATSLTGTLLPGGALAGDGYLWLFYANHSVQALRYVEDAVGRRGFSDIILPSLPQSVTVRSLAITKSGAWALVRVEDSRVLESIDKLPSLTPAVTPAPEAKDDKKAATDKAAPATPEPAPGKTKDGDIRPAPREAAIKADRLLHLANDAWVRVDLPADWSPDTPAWLVTLSQDMARPLLVTGPPSEKLIRWYRWDRATEAKDAAEAWLPSQQALTEPVRMAPTALRQQLVVVRRVNTPQKIELAFTMVRPERVLELGTLSLADAGGPWTLTPFGDHLALIAADTKGELSMNRIDIRGVADANPTPLAVEPPSLGPMADLLVFMIVLAIATPVLILMWKRDAGPLLAQLPRTLRIADMGPRAFAAMIDLLPGLLIASLITGASIEEVITFWPGRSGGWETMIPGAIVIGVFILSTFISELFTARTLGKAMMNLRVTGLQGGPPDLWQVLARNVFKALDLIAMPLLIFAIISPNKQRLGDVVARTLVVTKAEDDAAGGPRRQRQQDEEAEDEEASDTDAIDPRPRRKD